MERRPDGEDVRGPILDEAVCKPRCCYLSNPKAQLRHCKDWAGLCDVKPQLLRHVLRQEREQRVKHPVPAKVVRVLPQQRWAP